MTLGVLGSTSNLGDEFLSLLESNSHFTNVFSFRSTPRSTRFSHHYFNEKGFLFNSNVLVSFIPIWHFADFLSRNAGNLSSIARIFCLSSTSAIVKVHSSFEWERQYAKKFIDSEHVVASICDQHYIEYSLIRPTLIWGSCRDKNITSLQRIIANLGILVLPSTGSGTRYPIHASQLATVVYNLVKSEDIPSISIVLGPEQLTYYNMCAKIFHWHNLKPVIFCLPDSLAWLLACFVQFFTRRPDANPASFNRLNHSFEFTSKHGCIIFADGYFEPLSAADKLSPSIIANLTNRLISIFLR